MKTAFPSLTSGQMPACHKAIPPRHNQRDKGN